MRFLKLMLAFAALLTFGSPASATWYEAKSKHFVIYANDSPGALTSFATKLEKFDKAVRIVRAMDDPPIGDGGRLTIYVLPNEQSVSDVAVGRHSPIAGFYIPRASGSVAFVPKRTSGNNQWDASADIVFFHEYAHHIMLQNTDAALPPWLVEGFAEFFSTAEFMRDGSVHVGMPATHRAAGLFFLNKTPLEFLLTSSVKDNGSGADFDRFYGRAWLLTHYLTFDPKRHGQLGKYVAEIGAGSDLLQAARDAFGDLNQLDRDLDRYLSSNRFKYVTVNSPTLDNLPVTLRALRPGEVAIMPVRIRSTRGVDSNAAPEVAALARKVAASYPDDPMVQRALAEAEFDEHDYAAAERAANRALALDPAFVKALVYKGRAEMMLAASNPHADWTAIRENFVRANKLDTENPEPLMLYYESFGREGKRPTENAIDGLQYAMLLAPQDKRLRMMAVVELINSNKLAEARDALRPLAFDPHSSEGREVARKVMTALAANDAKGALAALPGGAR